MYQVSEQRLLEGIHLLTPFRDTQLKGRKPDWHPSSQGSHRVLQQALQTALSQQTVTQRFEGLPETLKTESSCFYLLQEKLLFSSDLQAIYTINSRHNEMASMNYLPESSTDQRPGKTQEWHGHRS